MTKAWTEKLVIRQRAGNASNGWTLGEGADWDSTVALLWGGGVGSLGGEEGT